MSTFLRMESAMRFNVQTAIRNMTPDAVKPTVTTGSPAAALRAVAIKAASGTDTAASLGKNDTGKNQGSKDANGNTKRLVQNRFDRNQCRSCKTRRYMDGSNDPGVSFKSPTSIPVEQSASAVAAHENEHVTRNAAKAQEEGREVISSTVILHTAICPECGVSYTAGGETTTVTREKPQEKAQQIADKTV